MALLGFGMGWSCGTVGGWVACGAAGGFDVSALAEDALKRIEALANTTA